MSPPLYALILFAAWALVLVFTLGSVRSFMVLTGRKRANEFPSGVPHGGDAYWRLNRAHLNTLENLPIFGAVVLTGTLAHVTTPAFLTLPMVVLGARIVQSLAHISSGSSPVVLIRFSAFLVQVASMGWMVVEILR